MKYQELKVQELPEQVPVGHIPRTLTVICKGEMTRKASPGDVVTIMVSVIIIIIIIIMANQCFLAYPREFSSLPHTPGSTR